MADSKQRYLTEVCKPVKHVFLDKITWPRAPVVHVHSQSIFVKPPQSIPHIIVHNWHFLR